MFVPSPVFSWETAQHDESSNTQQISALSKQLRAWGMSLLCDKSRIQSNTIQYTWNVMSNITGVFSFYFMILV